MGWFTEKKPEGGIVAGGNSSRGVPSKKGWKSVRDSDASAPLKTPVNNDQGFGHTGRKRRNKEGE